MLDNQISNLLLPIKCPSVLLLPLNDTRTININQHITTTRPAPKRYRTPILDIINETLRYPRSAQTSFEWMWCHGAEWPNIVIKPTRLLCFQVGNCTGIKRTILSSNYKQKE